VTKSIVLTELSDLARYRDEFANDTRAIEAVPPTHVVPPDADPDALIQAISRAARELQRLADTDASARREAEDVLATYKRLGADADSLRKLVGEARAVSTGAARLGDHAFLPESRRESEQLAVSAAAVETIAAKRLEILAAQMAELEQRGDLARLLAEERSLEETRQREERALRAIERAEALASGQKFNEALRLLGSAVKLNSNMPSLASSYDTIARRAHAVKTLEVERALSEARRIQRREPDRVAEILGALDLARMPSVLVRDVYGCWLHACRRLGLVDAVHYSPGSGRGAILVPDGEARLKVVASIGLTGWTAGRSFSTKALKGARPLA
jgi:tetratricopeptide (TPR) repeat protein